MPTDQEPPVEIERLADKQRKPLFRPNRAGPGWHPSSWQGWLILAVVVAAIVAVVALLRTGLL